jgi:cellulose synthase/poly-beta-1,6-N-acetylglucosamine synthase-like glycosyltransferase
MPEVAAPGAFVQPCTSVVMPCYNESATLEQVVKRVLESPYVSELVIVDEVGLVSPAVAKRRRQGPGWYTDVVDGERPDWIVIRRAVLAGGAAVAGTGAPFRSAAERDTLLARYARTTTIDEQAAGENALVILQRAR